MDTARGFINSSSEEPRQGLNELAPNPSFFSPLQGSGIFSNVKKGTYRSAGAASNWGVPCYRHWAPNGAEEQADHGEKLLISRLLSGDRKPLKGFDRADSPRLELAEYAQRGETPHESVVTEKGQLCPQY